MKITGLMLFGAGYVLGTRAGRGRYEQIVALAKTAASNLEQKSARQRILEYADGGKPLTQMFGQANGSSSIFTERQTTR